MTGDLVAVVVVVVVVVVAVFSSDAVFRSACDSEETSAGEADIECSSGECGGVVSGCGSSVVVVVVVVVVVDGSD